MRLGWKRLTNTNALAYYDSFMLSPETMMKNCLKTGNSISGANVLKLFTAVIYEFL
jgi:hypothetical protein